MLIFSSCSQSEEFNVEPELPEKIEGSFSMDDLPLSIVVDGTKIIRFVNADSLLKGADNFEDASSILLTRSDTRGGVDEYGPYYVSGTPRLSTVQNQKILINNQPGIASGVYICDAWTTFGKIVLPKDALFGKIGFPNPSGFKNYSTQELGVNWSLSTTAKGVEIDWNFYTIVLKYDSGGALLGWVIPLDGAEVRVPYYYYK